MSGSPRTVADEIRPPTSGKSTQQYPSFRLPAAQSRAAPHGGTCTSRRHRYVRQALAAGVPQLVRPMSFDQFDNSRRLVRLRVAEELSVRCFRGPAIAAALARDEVTVGRGELPHVRCLVRRPGRAHGSLRRVRAAGRNARSAVEGSKAQPYRIRSPRHVSRPAIGQFARADVCRRRLRRYGIVVSEVEARRSRAPMLWSLAQKQRRSIAASTVIPAAPIRPLH